MAQMSFGEVLSGLRKNRGGYPRGNLRSFFTYILSQSKIGKALLAFPMQKTYAH